MKTRLLILLSGALAWGFLLAIPTSAQQPITSCTVVQYFPETGHNVCDRFLTFFNARGGVEIFGYPLTEWFIEEGRLVQYFQRARMEYHPELSPRYHMQLGLLGDFFAPADAKARIPESEKPKSNDRGRRYFPETGHTVGYSFLKFYDENGGLDNFGYPVTEFIFENGRFVQYFQRALMEWDPNRGGIVLHNLGEMWIDQHRYLRQWTEPAGPKAPGAGGTIPTLSSVTSLHASASVRDAFTGRGGYQMVWVYVYNQNGEPVAGAEVTLVVHYVSGDRTFSMPLTDDAGHTQITFDLDNPTPGRLVIIDATAAYQGLMTQTQTSFFPWW
jgi:hypothetical protein